MTPEQTWAAESTMGDSVVVAGPGSGKTTTLIRRVVWLSRQDHEVPITCLTFTNAAAREMKNRIGTVAAPVFIGTLHAWCMRLIKSRYQELGFSSEPMVIVEDEAVAMLVETAQEMKLKVSLKKLVESYKLYQDLGTKAKLPLDLVSCFNLYRNGLIRMGGVTYEMILRMALKVLRSEKVHVGHLMVDEAQDSSMIDFQIFEAMEADSRWFCGDPDQSIYGFRGGQPDIMIHRAHSVGSTLFRIENCFRFGNAIADWANVLIARNEPRVQKVINPVSTDRGVVGVEEFQSEMPEIQATVDYVNKALVMGLSVGILARTNAIVDAVHRELKDQGVMHGTLEPKLKGWDEALIMARFLENPERNFTAASYLAMTAGKDQAEKAIEESNRTCMSINRMILKIPRPDTVAGFLDLLEIGNREVMSRIEALAEGCETPTEVVLAMTSEGRVDSMDDHAVSVSTIHGAKGHEWDCVRIIGAVDEVFPGTRKSMNIREERNLMFVAITRAKKECVITYSKRMKHPFQDWNTVECKPSRFIGELSYED